VVDDAADGFHDLVLKLKTNWRQAGRGLCCYCITIAAGGGKRGGAVARLADGKEFAETEALP
jgi:hypothetical protein